MTGDHIFVERYLLGMPLKACKYTHHGIDVGNGRVVHFSGEPGQVSAARIEVTTLEVFLAGGKKNVVTYKRCETFSRDEIVGRAMGRVGESGYSVVFNNCEHFARWCVTGLSRSSQVERVTKKVGRFFRSVFLRKK